MSMQMTPSTYDRATAERQYAQLRKDRWLLWVKAAPDMPLPDQVAFGACDECHVDQPVLRFDDDRYLCHRCMVGWLLQAARKGH